MSISLKTHKMLWGRAASRCAFPDCRRELVMDASETDDESLVGDECHIVAPKPSGPRGDYPLPPEQRDKYNNLILLCKVHHKLIDDQLNTYTVERLQRMKEAHEEWVRESFPKYDAAKQRDDELYAAYVEEWARRVDLDNWRGWSSRILSAQPWMTTAHDKELKDLGSWLLGRIWPKRYPELEAAFENFRRVLNDFHKTFSKHTMEMWGGEALWTEKFYQYKWDPHYRLLRQWYFHVDLVEDLT